MNFLFTISIRNLFRQRRRSILLGSAIAIGAAVLVIANAFAHGISEVLFNEIVTYVAGHVSVSFTKGGNANNQVFHDGERIRAIIKERVPSVKRVDEAIGVFARAVGNGKADNVILVGMDPSGTGVDEKEAKKLAKNFKEIEGHFANLSDTTIENPVCMAQEKAKALNVKLHDILRVRFTDIHGQTQAARLTVVCVMKPSNVFMSVPVFLHIKTVKKLLGYTSYDVPQLYLTINNPKQDAKRFADSLHAGLKPPLAVIDGKLSAHSTGFDATLLSLRTDSASLALADAALRFSARSSTDSANRKQSVIVSEAFSKATGIQVGDTCTVSYDGKFGSEPGEARLIVTAIAAPGCGVDGPVVLVNEKDFYKAFYDVWPKSTVKEKGPFRPDSSISIYKTFGGEWLLVPRSHTTRDAMKLYREIAQQGWKAIVVDVGSMYETASMVLNLEYALNMITAACVMVLFFIILIGVVNTLRMTIRERTREIGTIRAIGMQRVDVRNSFLIETGFLALISAVTGTIIAFGVMFGLSQLTFKAEANPLGMLLVEGHIFFAPTPIAVCFFIVLIVSIAVVTAYFPARRAAKLSAAEALRHFE